MPKYHLRNDWNAPSGKFYKKGDRANPTEVPEDLVKHLPTTAVEATPENTGKVRPLPVPTRRASTLVGSLEGQDPPLTPAKPAPKAAPDDDGDAERRAELLAAREAASRDAPPARAPRKRK
jgi:hypothetical protein